ncbi:SDR family oxidoreductase [Cellulomonas bogoriensis]|uniref:NAD-dependent dehydratase n=1 Tax=Cellulomonas bogoriensis 69B4 = DSM 16987 TaxID=1386082 RepID=A0A0A0BLZ9_9CELL|nr:SDR family oxidoreductase [Cellulomonas bogoriensis]KGM08991.1 NAD-dependent dehydratase [Cellulomonas bogoriensis 69B4 = DSM 16987]
MRIVIAGGHGQIAMRLTRRLTSRGDTVVGMVRNPDHVGDLAALGAEAAVVDLEHADVPAVAPTLEGADAVVFAAGAGPGSGIARKDTVDRAAAALLADAAEAAQVRRYVLVSAMGVDHADQVEDETFRAYLHAKAASEQDLRARDLDWTIVRPGGLTDDEGTGRVLLAGSVDRAQIPREDVAAVLAAVLDEPASAGLTLEVVSGEDLVDAAVQAASRGEPGDGSAGAVADA